MCTVRSVFISAILALGLAGPVLASPAMASAATHASAVHVHAAASATPYGILFHT
jgi:hypothetical protein